MNVKSILILMKSIILILLFSACYNPSATVSDSATAVTYKTYTTADGLPSNTISGVWVLSKQIFLATPSGLALSHDDGSSWTIKTTSDGLAGNVVQAVRAQGTKIVVGTSTGLSVSTNSGSTWTTYTTSTTKAIAGNNVLSLYLESSTIMAGTNTGLSITNDFGSNWTNSTTTNGLGSNTVNGVWDYNGEAYYAATDYGLSVSNDGSIWTNYTTANGLPDNKINSVYAGYLKVYAATANGFAISTITPTTQESITTNLDSKWVVRTKESNGLGSNNVHSFFLSGNCCSNTLFTATANGLSTSASVVGSWGGVSWKTKTTSNGLASNNVLDICVNSDASAIYVATDNGLTKLW